jgi:amino acid adenylation domain-containing protein
MLVHEFLGASARRQPAKPALICDGRRWTYSELDDLAGRCAALLRDRGVAPGDRVVIHLPNGVEAVVAIFGALRAGAVFVPVNPTTKPDKLAFILRNCRAAALVTESPAASRLPSPWLRTRVLGGNAVTGDAGSVRYDALPQFAPAGAVTTVRDDDLACLIYTSGSTGEPKGVMCEHRQVVFASGSIIQYLGNTEADIVLNALPLSFDYGLYQLLMTFRFGGTLVLERSFAFPAAILQRIAAERVTGFPGVPTLFALLLRQDLGAFDLSSLRYLTNTAAALPPSHALELRRRFPGAKIFSMYGLTETKRTLYLPPDQLERRPGSVGIPIPGTEAWIEDEHGRRCAPGQTGELVIRGPHVMRGYWEAPEATAQRFRPDPQTGGRLCYSGDLFRQDDEGYFYFVGRKDDIIKSRGEKVAPKEVETALCALAGVAEAAVLGLPDPVLGQAIKAFIVRRDPALTAAQVLAHCRARLEDFMVPQAVEFCDELPRNNSGKVDKRALALRRSPDRREPETPSRADPRVRAS